MENSEYKAKMQDLFAARARTAMYRTDLSRPLALALAGGLVGRGQDVFDYGCGRGNDIKVLQQLGTAASGWDPYFAADSPKQPAAIVNLGYVVNVIEQPAERAYVLREAWSLCRQVLLVAARLDWDVSLGQAVPHGDGLITAKGTFQKFYEHDELRSWIESELGTPPDAAAPGVFFVFRDATAREGFLARASTYSAPSPRQRITLSLDENRDLLQPLLDFLVERGRAPVAGELPSATEIGQRFGSIERAIRLLSHSTDASAWEKSALRRQRDLLVYLALGALRKTPRFSALPQDLQADIRAFFGSYTGATTLGRELLFAAGDQAAIARECASSPIGKLTPEALYVHVSAVAELPVLLRVYEGCGRVLYGDVPGATLVKLRRDKPAVSFLCYPDFDEDPHPRLKETFVAELKRVRTHYKSYMDRDNPPVLHRKECFVSAEYSLRARFEALTRAEERAGLLNDPLTIGTANGWNERLRQRKFVVTGHRLRKLADDPQRPSPAASRAASNEEGEWLPSVDARKALRISDSELAHRREAGELTWRKNGRRFEYLVKRT